MANPVFIEDADLWKRMGGQDKLTQLLDPQNTGTWDTGLSLTARTDACNKVIAAAGLQAELTNNVTDFLSLIHISEPTRPRFGSRMPSSA